MKDFKLFSMLLPLLLGSMLFSNNLEGSQGQEIQARLREKVSDNVLKKLAKSFPGSRRSDHWKEKIQTNGATVSTELYSSSPVCAFFDLKNNGGTIDIETVLSDTQWLKADTAEKEQRYKEFAEQYNYDDRNKEPLIVSDANDYTRCESAIRASFHEETRSLIYNIESQCTTRMQSDVFKAVLESLKKPRKQRFVVDALLQ